MQGPIRNGIRGFLGKARRRAFTRETGGSVHVLETMIVGLMVVGAVVAVSTMNVPVSQTEGFKTSQERLVQDALDVLAAQPSRDTSRVIFDTLLEEYVMKAVAGEAKPLMEYLNRTLPAGSQYNVFIDTGYGRPVPVIEGGSPPGESMAGARSFVPKMSYVFMVPEFQRYQEDFHMNVLAIPMHNSIIQRDEGHPVELSVTFTNDDGKEATQRVFAETALRYNDPQNRSWPSTSIYSPMMSGGQVVPTYYVDASDSLLSGLLEVDIFGTLEDLTGDGYNVTVPIAVEESAGHPIPRGGKIHVEFPRGWIFEPSTQNWLEKTLTQWTDFEWDGDVGTGWTISAHLKDPLEQGRAYFNLTGDFVMLLDTAYPFFHPVHVWMGDGAQGKSTILVDTPQELDLGGFRRDITLSTAKPMIAGKPATWGMNLANMGFLLGGDITIKRIDLVQPQGIPVFSDVSHAGGWTSGDWKRESAGHYYWEPNSGGGVKTGEAAWLAMDVIGGPTRDNHYRDHDYQDLLFHFNPENTTGPVSGDWEFSQRAHQMSNQYVYRQMVPPYEPELLLIEEWPGWPNAASSYWFGAESRQQNRYALGASEYDVGFTALLSQVFGDYQGAHVFSRLHTEDITGQKSRHYEVGERVQIKNDFSALFGRLNTIDLDDDVSVENIRLRSSVYTPDKAWTGKPTKVFEEDAGVDVTTGSFHWLLPTDITGNGILDVVAVDSDGLVYGLDGRDGSKLWKMVTKADVQAAALSDVTADGSKELVIGTDKKVIKAYRTGLDISEAQRELWSLDVDPSGLGLLGFLDPFTITAMEDLSKGEGSLGEPVLAVAVSSKVGGAYVVLVKTERDGDGKIIGVEGPIHTSDNPLDSNTVIGSLSRMKHAPDGGSTKEYLAVASMNKTVAVYSLPDLELHWITKLPQRALQVTVADLTGDGWDDVVVNTAALYEEENDSDAAKGDAVYVLPGRSGSFGPGVREVDPLPLLEFPSLDAGILSDGWSVVTGGHSEVLQDHSGFYSPVSHFPALGSCDLNSITQQVPVTFNLKMWDPEDVVSWLEDREWSGVHVERTVEGENLYIIARDGAILRAVDTCGDNRLRWTALFTETETGTFTGLHAYRPLEEDGSLYRMNTKGQIQSRTGEAEWSTVATVCSMGEVDCSKKVTVNRWDVQEDGQGRPVEFWATLEQKDPLDPSDTKGHLVSIKVSDMEGAGWTHHLGSASKDFHALSVDSDGAVWAGGGRSDGALFLMHRSAPSEAFGDQRVFYSNATSEHGGKLLDIMTPGHGANDAWAVDSKGKFWRSASQDTWVPYASWAPESGSGVLVADPSGTVWAFLDEFRHLSLHTHVPDAEVRLPSIPLDSSVSPGIELEVSVESDEAHLKAKDGDEYVTHINWFARAPGGPWVQLDRTSYNPYGSLGFGSAEHLGSVVTAATTDHIEVKAVLATVTTSTLAGALVQDPGMSPFLRQADVTVTKGSTADVGVAAGDMIAGSGASYVSHLHGWKLESEPPSWAYRGAMNLEVQLSTIDSRHNRVVQTGDRLTSTSDGPSVAIADRSDAWLYWWVLDGKTGIPQRPSSGQVGITGSDNMLFDLLVGDLTGDGIDNMALVGDFKVPVEPNGTMDETKQKLLGAEWGEMYQVLMWDTEHDEWQFVESDENHIVPAAVLTGPDKGRQTITFSVPTASFYLFLDGLDYEAEEPNFVTSFYGPRYNAGTGILEAPEMRWGTNPLESQGMTTFSYMVPRNSLFGTSIVVSEMRFDLVADGTTVTQTARLLDWFDILPPGREASVPPVYTVEVVAWFDEGYAQVERLPDNGGGGGGGGGNDGVIGLPDLKNVN